MNNTICIGSNEARGKLESNALLERGGCCGTGEGAPIELARMSLEGAGTSIILATWVRVEGAVHADQSILARRREVQRIADVIGGWASVPTARAVCIIRVEGDLRGDGGSEQRGHGGEQHCYLAGLWVFVFGGERYRAGMGSLHS